MTLRLHLLVGVAAVLVGMSLGGEQADAAQSFFRKTVNTNNADFEIVAAPTAGLQNVISELDIQNFGTANKVEVWLCDGTCGTAANIFKKIQLDPASASTQGGGWSLEVCNVVTCQLPLTAGRAFIMRVDTGATNSVEVSGNVYTR